MNLAFVDVTCRLQGFLSRLFLDWLRGKSQWAQRRTWAMQNTWCSAHQALVQVLTNDAVFAKWWSIRSPMLCRILGYSIHCVYLPLFSAAEDWLKPSVVLEAFEARAFRLAVACARDITKFPTPEAGLLLLLH